MVWAKDNSGKKGTNHLMSKHWVFNLAPPHFDLPGIWDQGCKNSNFCHGVPTRSIIGGSYPDEFYIPKEQSRTDSLTQWTTEILESCQFLFSLLLFFVHCLLFSWLYDKHVHLLVWSLKCTPPPVFWPTGILNNSRPLRPSSLRERFKEPLHLLHVVQNNGERRPSLPFVMIEVNSFLGLL